MRSRDITNRFLHALVGVALALSISVLVIGPAAALTITKTWANAETLTHTDLNASFTEVETAVTAIEIRNLLLGTANAALPNAIIVGTSPGGELAGAGTSWGSPVLSDNVTVTGWVMGASTATTPAADDNDTSLATSAYVQTELNAAGGRNLTCASGSCSADSSIYTVSYSFPFLASSVVDTNDVLVHEVEATFTPTRWSCVADGGSGLTTIDASIEECNTNGAACAGIGATSTVTVVNTTVADTSFTDTTLTVGNWLKFVFGTITWTSAGTFTCTLRGTRNDV